jgi:hypothetical protein
MQSGRDQPGEVRHVDDEVGTDGVGDLPEAREVELAGVGRPAGQNHLRAAPMRELLDLVHVDQARLPVDVVRDDVVQPPREVELHPVREVAAVRQLEPHHRVARRQQRHVGRRVRLRSGVRLHVGVVGAEQLAGPVDRELLDDVDALAAAVIALPRIALGVLVGEHGSLGLEDGRRNEVFGGDHLERALLALELPRNRFGDLGVNLGQRSIEEVGR